MSTENKGMNIVQVIVLLRCKSPPQVDISSTLEKVLFPNRATLSNFVSFPRLFEVAIPQIVWMM